MQILSGIGIITRFFIALCLALYIYSLFLPIFRWTICPDAVTYDHQYYRLITGSLFHGGLLHVAMNMLTYGPLGSVCERMLGSTCYLGSIIMFILSENILYVILGRLLHATIEYELYCSVGFSGVIFSLLVLETVASPNTTRSIFGMCEVPAWTYPWVLLLLLSFMIPNVSFVGHLCGILLGYMYAKGLLNFFNVTAFLYFKV